MSPTKSEPKTPPHDETRLTKGPARNRQRAFHSAKDYETSASQLGDVVAPPPGERTKVMRLVAGNVPKDEIIELLMMLGIHPDQPAWDDGPSTNPSRANGPKGM